MQRPEWGWSSGLVRTLYTRDAPIDANPGVGGVSLFEASPDGFHFATTGLQDGVVTVWGSDAPQKVPPLTHDVGREISS